MCLHPEEHHIRDANRGEVVSQLRPDGEVLSVGTDDTQPALLHRAQMRSTREQHHVGAGVSQPRADIAADRTSAGDDDSHCGWVENA